MAIHILPTSLADWRDELRRALDNQLAALGLPPGAVPFHDDLATLPSRAVVLYFGDGPYHPDPTLEGAIAQARARGHVVIPVLDDLEEASKKLPEGLKDLNALAVGAAPRDYGVLIREILARLWGRRLKRRIFLSYRRAESSGVAYQLHEALTRRGYEVFLDEFTLHAGEAVQQEIFWTLNDSDLVVLLCTPKLEKSDWVKDEISKANAMLVPILAFRWDGAVLPGNLFPDQSTEIGALDLDPDGKRHQDTLTPEALADALRKVDERRSAAITRRLEDLMPFARAGIARKYKPGAGPDLGELEIQDPRTGEHGLVRVVPFRPSLDEIFALRTDLQQRSPVPKRAYLFYPEIDVADARREALNWACSARRSETPGTYKLLSYLGSGASDLGDLAT